MDFTFERQQMNRIRVAFIRQCDDLGVDPVYALNAEKLLENEILRLQSQEYGNRSKGTS